MPENGLQCLLLVGAGPLEGFQLHLVNYCLRRLNTDPPGVRHKSWTGLCRKSEAVSVLEGTE